MPKYQKRWKGADGKWRYQYKDMVATPGKEHPGGAKLERVSTGDKTPSKELPGLHILGGRIANASSSGSIKPLSMFLAQYSDADRQKIADSVPNANYGDMVGWKSTVQRVVDDLKGKPQTDSATGKWSAGKKVTDPSQVSDGDVLHLNSTDVGEVLFKVNEVRDGNVFGHWADPDDPNKKRGPSSRDRIGLDEFDLTTEGDTYSIAKIKKSLPGITSLESYLQKAHTDTGGEVDPLIRKGDVTPAKAKQILKDGEANGKPLTEQQRKFFGAIAGGQEPRTEKSMSGLDGIEDYMEKAKYTKRTGTPGNYKYEYGDKKGRGGKKDDGASDAAAGSPETVSAGVKKFLSFAEKSGWGVYRHDEDDIRIRPKGSDRSFEIDVTFPSGKNPEHRIWRFSMSYAAGQGPDDRKLNVLNSVSAKFKENDIKGLLKHADQSIKQARQGGIKEDVNSPIARKWLEESTQALAALPAPQDGGADTEKSMSGIDAIEDYMEKAKYTKRTGTPGNYKYEYATDKKERGPKLSDEDVAHYKEQSTLTEEHAMSIADKLKDKKAGSKIEAQGKTWVKDTDGKWKTEGSKDGLTDAGMGRYQRALGARTDKKDPAVKPSGKNTMGGKLPKPQVHTVGNATVREYEDIGYTRTINGKTTALDILGNELEPYDVPLETAQQLLLDKKAKKSMLGIEAMEDYLSKSQPEVQEDPTEILESFSKALPTGQPKMGPGPEDGGPLAAKGKPAGEPNKSYPDGFSEPKVDGHPEDEEVLSADDRKAQDQMKEHKKPIETYKSAHPAYQRESVAYQNAVKISELTKSQDIVIDNPQPRMVVSPYQHTNTDAATEQLMKSEFYHGTSPRMSHPGAPISQSVLCKSCDTTHAAMLTDCPSCMTKSEGVTLRKPVQPEDIKIG